MAKMTREEFLAMIKAKKKGGAKEAADQKEDAADKSGKSDTGKESKADKKEDAAEAKGKKESTADRLKKLPFSRVKMKK